MICSARSVIECTFLSHFFLPLTALREQLQKPPAPVKTVKRGSVEILQNLVLEKPKLLFDFLSKVYSYVNVVIFETVFERTARNFRTSVLTTGVLI